MNITEILLIFAGVVVTVAGYLIPAGRRTNDQDKAFAEKDVHDMVRRSIEDAQEEIQSRVDDTVEESLVKTERGLDRITNEKISAISEYAETVLNDIHKNHDEVVFMYDMLNDKHKSLTSTVTEAAKKAEEVKRTVHDAELAAKEVRGVKETIESKEAKETDIKLKNAGFEPLISETTVKHPDVEKHVIRNLTPDSEKKAEKEKEIPSTELQQNLNEKSVQPVKNEEADKVTGTASQNTQILEMHKAGKSNMVIARELGLGIGEVSLVIELSQKHKKVR